MQHLIAILILEAAIAAAPQRLKIQVSVEPARAKPGDRVELRLDLEVQSGWKLYSPDFQGTGNPALLQLEKGPFQPEGSLLFPEPKRRKDEILNEEIRYHQGKFRYVQPLRIDPGAAPGKAKISGRFQFQTCSETLCDPPAEAPVAAEMEILEGGQAPAPGAPALPPLPGLPEKVSRPPPVKFTGSIVPARLAPGGRGTLVLRFEIAQGFHLYSTDHRGELGKPTAVVLAGKLAELAGPAAVEPPPREEDLPGEGKVRVLQGSGEIRQPFVLSKEAPEGKASLPFEVSFMACDASTCVDDSSRGEAALEVSREAAPGAGGLLRMILLAIVAGIVSVLMPCTYPMIPITISYFARQAQARKTSVVPLAIAYGAGIVLDFILIGLVVGPPIIEFAAHWITNTVVAVLFIGFGLSLLGLFEIRLPSALNDLASRAAGAGSYAGVFFLGTTLVITSFACTAPFIAGVLAGGTQAQGIFEVLVSMFFFGLTMALPFVGLALFPGFTKSLPKSGEWMHTLKVALGFLVIATALPFLAKADDVRGWGVLSRELYLCLASGIAATAALYLLGLLRIQGETGGEIGPLRLVLGMLVLVLSLFLLTGALGGRLGGFLETFVPSPGQKVGSAGPAAEGTQPWMLVEDDLEGGLERARREGKLALLNWSGVT